MSEETPKGSGSSFVGAAGAVVLLLAGYFGWGVYQNSTAPEGDAVVQTAAEAAEETAESDTQETVAATDEVIEETPVADSSVSSDEETAEAQDESASSGTSVAGEATASGENTGSETATAAESDTEDATESETVAVTTVVDEAAEDTGGTEEAQDQLADAEEAVSPSEINAPTVPVFDVVRIDAEGNALVAGNADPGMLEVLLEGEVLTETPVDGAGKFAALFTVAPSDQPRVMTLRATSEGEQTVLSEQSVIVEPFALTVVVAEAETESNAQADETGDETETSETGIAEASEETISAADEATEAEAATRTVIADEDGIRVLPGATAPNAMRIDTISYGSAGEVLIAGQGTEVGATARVYVNNTALVTAEIAEDFTWETVLPDVESGLYVLRVDQIAADGSVTSRAQIPFQRESVEAVLAAQAGVTETAVEEVVSEDVASETTEADEDIVVAAAAPEDLPVSNAVTNVVAPEATENAVQSDVTEITSADVIAVATQEVPVTVTEEPVVETAAVASEPTPARPQVMTVQPGFTLWGIASETYGDGFLYVQLFEANKDQIRDPDLIYPGQIFELPE